MKKYTEKELADFLLEMRQHNGRAPSWGYFKKHAARMFLLIGLVIVFFGLGVLAQSWGFSGFVFGLIVGIFSRDRAHTQQLQAVWPFYDKIIDWLKVERIANGEPSA